MSKNKETFLRGDRESKIEKEKQPQKVVLFIRHPSVKWLDMLLEKAEKEGKDIETYTPVDIEGLRMTRFLSQYLKENLADLLKEKSLNQKFSIITSPIKRAKSEAGIISTNLKLAHIENPEIPIPVNNTPIEIEAFEEMPWIKDKQEALDLVQEAEQKKTHPVKYWLEKDPDKVILRLNEQIPKVKEGLKYLRNSKTPVNLVFTHRLILSLILWSIKQQKKGREDLTITKDDLPGITDLCGKIAYTSINEAWLNQDGKWEVKSISKTPHLVEEPSLKKGTY